MRKFFLAFLLSFSLLLTYASKVTGIITDNDGKPLPYASVFIKGSHLGTTANSEGKFSIDLEPGTYTIVCQHVGYKREEKTITVGNADIQLDFKLVLQEMVLREVVVGRGEDPAYEIIRHSIAKRTFYRDQISKFRCEVYTKGQLRIRNFPNRLFGKKVDFEDGDTSRKKILYLSETISTYSVEKPGKEKIMVLSTKVSGQTDGFGLSAPRIYSFYDNDIDVANNLNPRGFISPISANALHYYHYHYAGSFFEDGKEINHIQVIPIRKYEPLFSGYINIIEGEWRIHSLQLQLTKASQMELIDTLRFEQLYVPLDKDVWVMKSQVIYPAINVLGLDAYGSFANVYSKFDTDPQFEKNFFDNTLLKYQDSSNKKSPAYWEKARPLPLQKEEVADYRKKDSLEQVRRDPHYLDSLDKRRNRLSLFNFILGSQTFSRQKSRSSITIPSLLELAKYNTVEGFVLNPQFTYLKRLDSSNGRRAFSIKPSLRYGFSNHHFNAFAIFNYVYGKKYFKAWNFSGGKRVFQFNNQSLQGERGATISALLYANNRRKIYEAWYARARFEKALGEGFNWNVSLQYQDRMPLANTTDYTWSKTKSFTPNYPEQFVGPPFLRNQALIGVAKLTWHPGNRYIEFPDRKVSIGSKYPTFSLSYTKGISNLLGSDVDYDKWRFEIRDDLPLKLAGRFSYRLSTGGFLNSRKVQIPDYFHLDGNLSTVAENYMGSFQLLPNYKYSNTEKLFSMAFVEYHLNGLLSNKIPVFRKMNWYFETGSNAFYVRQNLNYVELFGGVENILKIIRVDFVQAFLNGKPNTSGIRISIRGITGGRVED